MSAEVETLRGRIEALELISIAVLTKIASEDADMRSGVAKAMESLWATPVDGLSPVALTGFRDVLGRALRNLDPQGL